jgi:hypothetical protein
MYWNVFKFFKRFKRLPQNLRLKDTALTEAFQTFKTTSEFSFERHCTETFSNVQNVFSRICVWKANALKRFTRLQVSRTLGKYARFLSQSKDARVGELMRKRCTCDYLSARLSVCLSVCLSFCLSVCPHTRMHTVYIYVHAGMPMNSFVFYLSDVCLMPVWCLSDVSAACLMSVSSVFYLSDVCLMSVWCVCCLSHVCLVCFLSVWCLSDVCLMCLLSV